MIKSRLELSADQYQKMFKELGFDKYSVIRDAKLNLTTVEESMDRITKMCNWAYVEGMVKRNKVMDVDTIGTLLNIVEKDYDRLTTSECQAYRNAILYESELRRAVEPPNHIEFQNTNIQSSGGSGGCCNHEEYIKSIQQQAGSP